MGIIKWDKIFLNKPIEILINNILNCLKSIIIIILIIIVYYVEHSQCELYEKKKQTKKKIPLNTL